MKMMEAIETMGLREVFRARGAGRRHDTGRLQIRFGWLIALGGMGSPSDF
jgi:hypothetical protein